MCDVLVKGDFDWLIIVQFQLAGVESFFFGVVQDGVQRVSLSQSLKENIDRYTLLPEAQIGDQLVSLTIVDETEVVTVLLFNLEFSLRHFSSMSSNLNLFSFVGENDWDIEVFERFFQDLRISQLCGHWGKVGHSHSVWGSSHGSVGLQEWIGHEQGRLNFRLVGSQWRFNGNFTRISIHNGRIVLHF